MTRSGIVFAYYKNPDRVSGRPDFACKLHCMQCKAMAKGGSRRCKNRTCFGLPVCHVHLRSDYHLVIAKSNIEGAGNGLFAWDIKKQPRGVVFKKGELIVKYEGEKLGDKDVDGRYGEGDDGLGPYTLEPLVKQGRSRVGTAIPYGNQTLMLDAACARGAASFANGVSNVREANAKLDYRFVGSGEARRRVAGIFAKKNIRHKDEILVNYGENYDPAEPGISHLTKRTGNTRRARRKGFTANERTNVRNDLTKKPITR